MQLERAGHHAEDLVAHFHDVHAWVVARESDDGAMAEGSPPIPTRKVPCTIDPVALQLEVLLCEVSFPSMRSPSSAGVLVSRLTVEPLGNHDLVAGGRHRSTPCGGFDQRLIRRAFLETTQWGRSRPTGEQRGEQRRGRDQSKERP